jgi:hypothetical protein
MGHGHVLQELLSSLRSLGEEGGAQLAAANPPISPVSSDPLRLAGPVANAIKDVGEVKPLGVDKRR